MKKVTGDIEITLGNFQGHCCEMLLKFWLESEKIPFKSISGNLLILKQSVWMKNTERITDFLTSNGLYVIMKPQERIAEAIMREVHHLVFESGYASSMVNNSDYLVEKLGMSYQRLSTLFKKEKQITLEKYIIAQKIERVKQIIVQDELTLSEIAYMMGYSSVQYLSTQFKAVTGVSVSDYRSQFE
ncbi:MAG: hypothetical protein A2W93_15585 [Bacteroidetes bacterium GWF2_43_63]|nr:MAG: hypothetical protein A2W94_05355 [Bacteroidetes bacterium GWE2_42_42]OFY53441.1 MAG: hypothetical protein A2W93_15585 [Bacteroidetes bacterium GWF2_43_63]